MSDMSTLNLSEIPYSAEIPDFVIKFWAEGGISKYCLVIPVINEGNRILSLLQKIDSLRINKIVDTIIVDGGSTDGSLEEQRLQSLGVKSLVLKTGPGKVGGQLRCAYALAISKGYQGIITIDGNDKDDPDAIFSFINALDQGIDFVQASRFIPGGIAVNTPKSRELAIKFIHAPLLSLFSGFKWTDTTQGFRAYSKRLLIDPDLAIFRDAFSAYEFLFYMSYRTPHLKGYTCKELPTARRYPVGEIPTKISGFKGNLKVLMTLLKVCFGLYNPKNTDSQN